MVPHLKLDINELLERRKIMSKHFFVFSQEELDKIKKWWNCDNRRFPLV